MEDAKSLSLSLSKKHPDLSLFGVYDGHGAKISRETENMREILSNPSPKKEIILS